MPEKIFAAMQLAWLWLAAQHPAAPWCTIPVIAWLANWAIRTWLPTVWEWCATRIGSERTVMLRKAVQTLPSVVMGAIIVAFAQGGQYDLIVGGALVALGAPLWHELLKWASAQVPGPTYLGGAWPAAGKAQKRDAK
jgi:hypothetical protein